jgi:phosphoribosylamine---glycine ligase
MNIGVIGSGGREYALAKRLRSEGHLVFAWPGNEAMRFLSVTLLDATNETLAHTLAACGVQLVIVGPERYLVAGLVDELRALGVATLGPTASQAVLEGSKGFAREWMKDAQIPSPDYVRGALHEWPSGVVVKLDGLAAGKGVRVCDSAAEAQNALRELCGDAKEPAFLCEERLFGLELSATLLLDESAAVLLPFAQDYKRLSAGDQGPLTGGMGAVSPPAWLTEKDIADVIDEVVAPTLRALREERWGPYRGFLYLGLMLTRQGPRVLEYNVRLGDPEAQVVLRSMPKSLQWSLIFDAASKGSLREYCLQNMHSARSSGNGETLVARERVVSRCEAFQLFTLPTWHPPTPTCALAVVLARKGYPASQNDDGVAAIDLSATNLVASEQGNVEIMHASTKRDAHGAWVTGPGRVLSVVANAANLAQARAGALREAQRLTQLGASATALHYRTDIGASPAARVAILFSGRGSNMHALLTAMREGLLAGLAVPVLALSNRTLAGGIAVAREFGVPVEVIPEKQIEAALLIERVARVDPDLVLLAGFDRILPPAVVAAFAGRMLNIHPADPVKFRGLGAYAAAFREGWLETKITVHEVDEGVDSGPVVLQQVVSLAGCETEADVEARGLVAEHVVYPEATRRFLLQRKFTNWRRAQT